MKPVSPISRHARPSEALRPFARHHQNQPATDWSFQPAAPDVRGGSAPHHPGARHPAFHTLSQGFFAAEADRHSRFEGAAFAVIVALVAWPIALAFEAAVALSK